MSCEYAEKEMECLRLSECGLRGMIYEFRESWTTSKVTIKSEISKGFGVYFKVLGFSEKMECDVYE